jgi:hypothetical protein
MPERSTPPNTLTSLQLQTTNYSTLYTSRYILSLIYLYPYLLTTPIRILSLWTTQIPYDMPHYWFYLLLSVILYFDLMMALWGRNNCSQIILLLIYRVVLDGVLYNFECANPFVYILMYWIYWLPSTQQTIGYNGFTTTCFDSHESSSGYVQNLSVLVVLLLTVLVVVGRYEVVAVLTLILTFRNRASYI